MVSEKKEWKRKTERKMKNKYPLFGLVGVSSSCCLTWNLSFLFAFQLPQHSGVCRRQRGQLGTKPYVWGTGKEAGLSFIKLL